MFVAGQQAVAGYPFACSMSNHMKTLTNFRNRQKTMTMVELSLGDFVNRSCTGICWVFC